MARDILIVDDEADIRMLITGVLHDEGYATREAANSDSALEAIADRRPGLMILDIWLQNSRMDGLEILNAVKREHPSLPMVPWPLITTTGRRSEEHTSELQSR